MLRRFGEWYWGQTGLRLLAWFAPLTALIVIGTLLALFVADNWGLGLLIFAAYVGLSVTLVSTALWAASRYDIPVDWSTSLRDEIRARRSR